MRFPVHLLGIIGIIHSVAGTLSPDGTLPLDCGSEQTFTCSVSVAAVWSINSPSGGLTIVTDTGLAAASANSRITTSDTSGNVDKSSIAINGFSETDNGTVISCIDRNDGSVHGTVLLSIRRPPCPTVNAFITSNNTIVAVTLAWDGSTTPVANTTVRYCPISSPNCTDTARCTVGRGEGCVVGGLDPDTEYQFTVTPNNNCGTTVECALNVDTAHHVNLPTIAETLSSTEIILVGVIPGATILLFGMISVAIAVLVSKHCYNKNASQKISRQQPMHDVYDQVDIPKTYNEIPVTTNPAYGTSSAQEGKDNREPYDQVDIPKKYDEIPVTTNPAYGTSSPRQGKDNGNPDYI